jgi:hypothetical protein
MPQPNSSRLAEGSPSIVLAGLSWPIPQLPIRINKLVVPAIARYLERNIGNTKSLVPTFLDEASFGDLIIIVHHALTAAHEISLQEFEDMPIQASELVAALDTIAMQSGMFAKRAVGAQDPAHEKKASTTSPPTTGMDSSPTSSAIRDGRGTTPKTPSPSHASQP